MMKRECQHGNVEGCQEKDTLLPKSAWPPNAPKGKQCRQGRAGNQVNQVLIIGFKTNRQRDRPPLRSNFFANSMSISNCQISNCHNYAYFLPQLLQILSNDFQKATATSSNCHNLCCHLFQTVTNYAYFLPQLLPISTSSYT